MANAFFTGGQDVLILGRNPNERIVIDTGKERIELVIASVRGSHVRIGFVADRHVAIYRAEIEKQPEPAEA